MKLTWMLVFQNIAMDSNYSDKNLYFAATSPYLGHETISLSGMPKNQFKEDPQEETALNHPLAIHGYPKKKVTMSSLTKMRGSRGCLEV